MVLSGGGGLVLTAGSEGIIREVDIRWGHFASVVGAFEACSV